mgnify:CR=1 FL=1
MFRLIPDWLLYIIVIAAVVFVLFRVDDRADAPEGAGVDVRSYVTTLTFSAITAIPAYPEPPRTEPQRQRRRGLDRGR